MRKRTHIHAILKRAREQKLFPGCCIGYIDTSGAHEVIPFGTFTYDDSSPKVEEDTIYDTASITKSIPTSSLALYLIDQGKVQLSDTAIMYLPEMRHTTHTDITIQHLLTQSIDLYIEGRLADYRDKSPDEILDIIFSAPLRRKPGTSYLYTNATSILLGLIIERVSGQSLDVFAQEVFFQPLGMHRTTFHPERFATSEIVPTEVTEDGLIHGIVHDESARKLQEKYRVGSAGLFSSVPDLLRFVHMILQDGKVADKPYFSKSMIDLMTEKHFIAGQQVGLGWELNQRHYIGEHASERTISKTGFTGCVVVIDIMQKQAFVMLSNYTFPKRKATYAPLNALRSAIADVIFSDE